MIEPVDISRAFPDSGYCGLLLIGDPHLEGRQPGFRRDDYPRVILDKLRWCLDYAEREQLLPALLGDLFEKPRDNPVWMLGDLITLMKDREIIAIYGNHDCAGTALDDHDSLSLLVKSGAIRLIDENNPWHGLVRGRLVIVGGSSWRHRVPRGFDSVQKSIAEGENPLVIWLAHHDVITPGYDAGRIASREIAAVDLVVNGHIHRRLEPVMRGRTLWLTPGNISRRSRSSAARTHVPAVLRVDIWPDRFVPQYVEIPHAPADDVFHEAVFAEESGTTTSQFVEGLRELQLRRTDSGAGLHQFLEQNLDQFPDDVAAEIRRLATLLTGAGAIHG